jgi:hypothetical protein
MRPLRLVLAAAFALSALVTATGALAAGASADDVTKVVTPLVAAAQAPCTITDSRLIGAGALPDKSMVKTYEVACQEGLGLVVIAKDKPNPEDKPTIFDCLLASQPGPDGKPASMACKLKGNLDPTPTMQKLINTAGTACTVDKDRSIGATAQLFLFEVACKDGEGYVLTVPSKVGGPAPNATTCLVYGKAGNISCTLTTPAQQLSVVDTLVASSGKPCTIKDKRYVLATTSGDTYYEVACTDGKGFMISSNRGGKFGEAIDCVRAAQVGGGCTLSDARLAQTEESHLYSDLAKKAGFDCQVSKYSLYATKDPTTDVVEMACSNRPDGGVGIFPASGPPVVYDCLRAMNRGIPACQYTPTSALFGKLTAQLKAKKSFSCVVSDARAMQAPSRDLIEVACADGNPGYVLEYPGDGNGPPSLTNCVQIRAVPGAVCQFASNKQK